MQVAMIFSFGVASRPKSVALRKESPSRIKANDYFTLRWPNIYHSM